MKIIVAILAVLAIGGGFAAYRQRAAQPIPATTAQAAVRHAAAASPTISQHNWPKNALDRAADVKRQVVEQRKSNDAH